MTEEEFHKILRGRIRQHDQRFKKWLHNNEPFVPGRYDKLMKKRARLSEMVNQSRKLLKGI